MELFRWCAGCEADEMFERPAGPDSAEACCTSCGFAVFLWAEWPAEAAAVLAAAA